MKPPSNIETFILAGGKSSWMGQDKGLVNLDGRPMIAYVLETLKKCNLPMSIIAHDDDY